MRRKKAEEQRPANAGATRIQPMDVQQVEFRLAFRGYNERDVDAFLDRVTEDLAAYIEENGRLRAAPGSASIAVADMDARSQAEEILARARDEAAAIVRDAEIRAATAGAPAGVPRAAIAPFLSKEREFLQALGGLVQGHAEDVKEMVLSLRSRSDAALALSGASAPATQEDAVVAEGSGEDAPAAAAEEETAAAGPRPLEEVSAPIRVPDPEEAPAKAETVTEEVPARTQATTGPDQGPSERSLRDLFWGED